MNRQKLIVPRGIAGSQILVSMIKSGIFSEAPPCDQQRNRNFQEQSTLEKEYILWEAAGADVDYIQNMLAHNI